MKVVNIRVEPYDVFIGRGSKWGNPYSHIPNSGAPFPVDSREDAIRAYSYWILEQPELLTAAKIELRGKVLGCYCKPIYPCHGDILLRIANE
jgi:hypothetical protein